MKRVPPAPELVNVVVRHDLDGGNVDAMRSLCEVDAECGVGASIQVLVDGELYYPGTVRKLVGDLRQGPFEVGLHTQAWMHANYEEALRDDIERFSDLFSFSPATITIHGAWPRTEEDMRRRKRFVTQIPALIRNTSVVGYNETFDWVSEDSSIRGIPVPLTEHFFRVADGCFLGGIAVILTHDNHWQCS